MFGKILVSTVHPHILRTQASIVLVADACRYIPKPIAGVNKLIRETCKSGFSGFPPPIQCSASAWGATGRPQAALRSHQLSGASPNKQLWWALVPAILGLCILSLRHVACLARWATTVPQRIRWAKTQACLRTAVGEHKDEVVTTLLERQWAPLSQRQGCVCLQMGTQGVQGSAEWISRWNREWVILVEALGSVM